MFDKQDWVVQLALGHRPVLACRIRPRRPDCLAQQMPCRWWHPPVVCSAREAHSDNRSSNSLHLVSYFLYRLRSISPATFNIDNIAEYLRIKSRYIAENIFLKIILYFFICNIKVKMDCMCRCSCISKRMFYVIIKPF